MCWLFCFTDMATYSFLLRDAATKEVICQIPTNAWLFFEYDAGRSNDVGQCQGILSTRRFEWIDDFLKVRTADDNLDAILEVWRRPNRIPGYARPQARRDAQYLVRYQRQEHLNDGRPRYTMIGRDQHHLLTRPIMHPPGDLPLIVTDAASQQTAVDSYTTGTPPPPVFAEDNFIGGGETADTAQQMFEAATWAKTTLPPVFSDIDIAPVVSGGIPSHPISLRYESSLLLSLQRMSAASWFAWYNGIVAPTDLPCDFSLQPIAGNPGMPWTFTIHVGGRGRDLRVGNTVGNAPVILSPGLDNVIQPVFLIDRLEEVTSAVVAGQGNGKDRQVISVRDAAAISHSPWNVIEEFVHASKISDFTVAGGIDEAVTVGQLHLHEKGSRTEITAIARQRVGAQYGIDIEVGDLVTTHFLGEYEDVQIQKIQIQLFNNGTEKTLLEFRRLDGSQYDGSDEYQKIVRLIADAKETGSYSGEQQ